MQVRSSDMSLSLGHSVLDTPATVSVGRADINTSRVTVASYFHWKLGWDRILATILLVPAVPVILGLIVLVRLTSSGPGIFRQLRVGLAGKPYVMFKIRTMQINAETQSGPVWAKTNDPRVTWLGYWIRRFH